MADADPQKSSVPNKLKLCINIEPELGQKTNAGLNIFSITEGHAENLCNFGYSMQELVKGCHLTIYSPDETDPEQVVASNVIFSSARRDSTLCFHMIDECKTREDVEGILLIHLKAFMSLSSLMHEGKNLVDYLCALKLMNPDALISFFMDCISMSHLDLSEATSLKCGTHNLYAEPQKCFIRNLNNDYIWGTPIVHHFESNQTRLNVSDDCVFGHSITCILCFIPMHERDDPSGVVNKEAINTTRTHDHVHGQAFYQVYDKNGLPIDMISFQKFINIEPDHLVSWTKFRMQVKKSTLKDYPYSVQWLVRIIPDTNLPQGFNTCSQFVLHFCFVLNEMEGYQLFSIDDASRINNDIISLRECADSCMKFVFMNHEDNVLTKPQNQTANNVFEYWIPDIANSLEEIFTRSTNAEFRSTFGKYIHPNNGVRDKLESLLWHSIRPARNCTTQDPHAEHTFSSDAKKVTGLCLSPHTPVSRKDNDIFTPDSLENDDHEWDTTTVNMRTDGLEENINDEECPLNLNANSSVVSSFNAYQYQFRGKNSPKNKISTLENEVSFELPFENRFEYVNQNIEEIESVSEYKNTNKGVSFFNCQTVCNLTNESCSLDRCESVDSREICIEKVSSVNETKSFDDSETKAGNTGGRFVKKRSFEESESSLMFDTCEVEVDDWMNLEEDLDQMKKLKLCDSEIKDNIHSLSNAIKLDEEELPVNQDPLNFVEPRNAENLCINVHSPYNEKNTNKASDVLNKLNKADIYSSCSTIRLDEEEVPVCKIIHEDPNCNTVLCRDPLKLVVESGNSGNLCLRRHLSYDDEQTTDIAAKLLNKLNEVTIFSDICITETGRNSKNIQDVNFPNISQQKENVSLKQEESEIELEKREKSRDAEKACDTVAEQMQEYAREELDLSSMEKSLSEADATENEEEEDWFDNKKLMDWYKSLYN